MNVFLRFLLRLVISIYVFLSFLVSFAIFACVFAIVLPLIIISILKGVINFLFFGKSMMSSKGDLGSGFMSAICSLADEALELLEVPFLMDFMESLTKKGENEK